MQPCLPHFSSHNPSTMETRFTPIWCHGSNTNVHKNPEGFFFFFSTCHLFFAEMPSKPLLLVAQASALKSMLPVARDSVLVKETSQTPL